MMRETPTGLQAENERLRRRLVRMEARLEVFREETADARKIIADMRNGLEALLDDPSNAALDETPSV